VQGNNYVLYHTNFTVWACSVSEYNSRWHVRV